MISDGVIPENEGERNEKDGFGDSFGVGEGGFGVEKIAKDRARSNNEVEEEIFVFHRVRLFMRKRLKIRSLLGLTFFSKTIMGLEWIFRAVQP